ncbi:MAG: DUF1501 domain-containing protein [Pedosphaera sp.]|nr:DUF1501 domain-containing protein [Pedosphaera sp.]MST00370.1 DUF1501 domain-containing protein [Pedosphaera sp.]
MNPRQNNHGQRSSRREFLRVGALGAAGLSLPQLLAARQVTGGSEAKADSCLIIFLNGGPSHLDMWDMKPEAPAEIRGEFRPINTTLSGVQLCEHLPRLARQLHHCTLVRSMNHSVNNSHAAAVYAALTGHDRGEQGGGAKPGDHPNMGSVLAKLRPSIASALPYVALPYKTQEGAGGPLQPGFLGGFIGAHHDPFWVLEDPSRPDFRVQNLTPPEGVTHSRLESRDDLLRSLDRTFLEKQADSRSMYESLGEFQRRAFNLLTADTTRRAFELEREAVALRESYGRNIYGQSVLLARRLIEAGTRVVTMSWAPDANATWDTHGGNFQKLKTTLLPQFDAACASLLDDLNQRGLLRRTLVAVIGDFGRTPRINNNAGRDHWNACYSVMLAGGGIKAGFVHGASDRTGSLPSERPTSPGDIIATIYHLLGVDPRTELHDNLSRPHMLVPQGRVLDELIA